MTNQGIALKLTKSRSVTHFVKTEEIEYGFGPHLMVDCYGCPKEKLADMDFLFNVLDTFPKKIGMNKKFCPKKKY